MNLLKKISFSLERLSTPAVVVTERAECQEEHLQCDENTLFKVTGALRLSGLSELDAVGAVSAMQNAGILFREHDI